MIIRPLAASDWEQVADIYRQGIATGNATFETDVPTWEVWDRSHREDCRLVAVEESTVVAWAALSPVSDRCVYGGVAENSIYVGPLVQGRGVGRRLLQALVDASEAAGIWTLQTGIFPENQASIALHQACGFRVVGVREKVGARHGIWRDVVFMERRSRRIGR